MQKCRLRLTTTEELATEIQTIAAQPVGSFVLKSFTNLFYTELSKQTMYNVIEKIIFFQLNCNL